METPAPEHATSHRSRLRSGTALGGALAATLLAAALPGPAGAMPQGGTVVSGGATITQSGNQLKVTQTTPKVAINWQSYGIAANEIVTYYQPSPQAIALNRVLGGGGSNIYGQLNANGQIWISNPAGIFFGPGSRVAVGGLIATTHDLKVEDFNADRYLFRSDSQPAGIVENQGAITVADAGLAAFVAPGVVNHGSITARLGQVTLASGNEFTVDLYGDQKINLALDNQTAQQVLGRDGRPLDALVKTDGKIFADGGRVQLSAAAAKGIVDTVISVGGIVQARSVQESNGEIILSGEGGAVEVTGTLDASGRSAGLSGGAVTVTAPGDAVKIKAGARIDVSGAAGGGQALIGGDFRGGAASAADYEEYALRPARKPVPPAETTTVEAGAAITADALTSGRGGEVIVWSDGATSVRGGLSARGGGAGGDGGFIETSGHWLDVAGIGVSTLATRGTGGTWLLDPYNVTIGASGANVSAGGTYTPSSNNSFVDVATLNAALNGGNTVTITTSGAGSENGDITVMSPISWTGTHVLTLNADNDIIINAPITANGSAVLLNLIAVNSINDRAAIDVGTSGGVSFTSSAGSVYIRAPLTVGAFGASFTTHGGSGDIIVLGPITANNNGNLSFLNQTSLDLPVIAPWEQAPVTLTGATTAGRLSINNDSSYLPVNTPADLAAVAACNCYWTNKYYLNADLDFTSYGPLTHTIGDATNGAFSGIFEGLGHSISHLSISLPSATDVGLFGYINQTGLGTGIVRDFGLLNSSVSGQTNVGAVAGRNKGLIEWVGVENSSVNGNSASASFIGGLAGYNEGSIWTSYFYQGTVSAAAGGNGIGGVAGLNTNTGVIGESFAKGLITVGGASSAEIGGLAGESAGTISDSYALGTISGGSAYVGGLTGMNMGTVSNSYAGGTITPAGGANSATIGALIGSNTSSANPSVSNSVWPDTGTGTSYNGINGSGIVVGSGGGTMTQAVTQGTYTGWDFTNIWAIDASSLPYLKHLGHPYYLSLPSAASSATTTTTNTNSGNSTASASPNLALNPTVTNALQVVNAINQNPANPGLAPAIAGPGAAGTLPGGAEGPMPVLGPELGGLPATSAAPGASASLATISSGGETGPNAGTAANGQETATPGTGIPGPGAPVTAAGAPLAVQAPNAGGPALMMVGSVPILTTPVAPTLTQLSQTPQVQQGVQAVGTALTNSAASGGGGVHDALVALNTGATKLTMQEQKAVFANVPTPKLVGGLLASANPVDKAVGGQLSQVAGGNVGLRFGDVKAMLARNGVTGTTAQTYLAMFQVVHKEAMTTLFRGALQELSANPRAADLGAVAAPTPARGTRSVGSVTASESGGGAAAISSEAFARIALPRVSVESDAAGRTIIRGRIEQWQPGMDLSQRDAGRHGVQVASLDGGTLEDLLGTAPPLPQVAAAPASTIEGWTGGRQVRINGRWIFVRDDGSFEVALPAGSAGEAVKLTIVDEHGQVQEQSPAIQATAPMGATAGRAPQPRKLAVLFANSDYSRNGIPDLNTPANDVARVSEVLHNKLGFVTRVLANATKAEMVQAIEALHSEAAESDQVFIYYAGHGYENERTGVGYWLPVDATTSSAKNWMSTRDLARLLRRVPAKNIMLVADSCYSGSFTKEQNFDAGSRAANLEELGNLRGVMAMSSGGDEPVMDGEVNSPFARALVDRMKEVAVATAGEDLYNRVKADVTANTPQTPQYGVISSAGYDPGADYLIRDSRTRVGVR